MIASKYIFKCEEKEIYDPSYQQHGTKTVATHETVIENGVTLEDIVGRFEHFLKSCGFYFDSLDVIIEKEE